MRSPAKGVSLSGTEGSNPSRGVREVDRKELMGGISHIGVSKLPFFLVREENKSVRWSQGCVKPIDRIAYKLTTGTRDREL